MRNQHIRVVSAEFISTLKVVSLHFLAKYLIVPSAVGNRQIANWRLETEDYFLACLVPACLG